MGHIIRFLAFACIYISIGIAHTHSQVNGIHVVDFESPPNKLAFDATRTIKDHLSSAGLPVINQRQEDSDQTASVFAITGRFAESGMMSKYGYLIVEVIYDSKYPVWRYTEPVRGRAKFGLSKRGSERTHSVLLDMLDQFIADYTAWEQNKSALTWLGDKLYRSLDDSLKTYRHGGEGLIRHGSVHRAVVKDSLYYHNGKWIPVQDVKLPTQQESAGGQEGTNRPIYSPQATAWTVSMLDNYYSTNRTQPIESKYISKDSEEIAIIKEAGRYTIISTQSKSYAWQPGSFKGSFLTYQVNKPFDLTWITDGGDTLTTTCTINNSGLLTIQLDGNHVITYHKVKA